MSLVYLVPLALVFLSSAIIANAHADPFITFEKGIDYDKEFIGTTPEGLYRYKHITQPERIKTDEGYKDYILTENATMILLRTANSGSVAFNKSTCSYDFYEGAEITNPKLRDISWTVKGKLATSSTWSNVTSINNASCSAMASPAEKSVIITGTKQNTAGTFQIVLHYISGHGIKENMRAYNNNPAWTNHNIGFTETIKVPRVINFGGQTFDLADHNDRILNRTWIENNDERLIKLTNKINYDFGIGFDNLNDIKIIWDGSQAKLALNYLYPTQTVPYQTWFEVDPTVTITGTSYNVQSASSVAATCGVWSTARSVANLIISKAPNANNNDDCGISSQKFPITSIPDSAEIAQVQMTYSLDSVTNGRTCAWRPMTTDPATEAAATMAADILDGTAYLSADTGCQSAGNHTITFSSAASTDLQNNLSGVDFFAVGMSFDNMGREAGVDHDSRDHTPNTLHLIVEYNTVGAPDAVDTLEITNTAFYDVDVEWDTPALNNGTVSGYQINSSTPWGDPQTILVNDTASTDTSYNISGLSDNTQYSFRIGVRTQAGLNASGNIANTTTLDDVVVIGNFSISGTNPDIVDIFFERDDINDTATYVNVTYPNTYSMACTLTYKFAQSSNTYYNLSGTAISSDEDESAFLFTDPENEVVDFLCWDQTTNASGKYVLTQNDFLIKQQIQNFRNGVYGTSGDFGAFDLVTLLVIILSMIGLNRVNESVGAIFTVVIIGALAYFEIITWPTVIISAVALVVLLAVTTTRKD